MTQIAENVRKYIEEAQESMIGQHELIKTLFIALLTNSHVLLEGLPGTGKTHAVKKMASMIDAQFGRIQFTPDLLPSDVTGTMILQRNNNDMIMEFRKGPIFNNIVLADEVNRAPAKVQSALLEAMSEGTVTCDGKVWLLPAVFMVLATQNPLEQEGTFPLPEAQLDRFNLKVNIRYSLPEVEKLVIRMVREQECSPHTVSDANQQTADITWILNAREEIKNVQVSELIEQYIVALIMATRESSDCTNSKMCQWIVSGVSARASIALDRCARALAWLDGRTYVTIDDVRELAPKVLAHRIRLSYEAKMSGVTKDRVIAELLNTVKIG